MRNRTSNILLLDMVFFNLWLGSAKRMIKWLIKSNQLCQDMPGTIKEKVKTFSDIYCSKAKEHRKLWREGSI